MKIEFKDPAIGNFSWELPDLEKASDHLNQEELTFLLKRFITSILLIKLIPGELGEKGDGVLKIALTALDQAASQIDEIKEGKRPYPLTRAVDMMR